MSASDLVIYIARAVLRNILTNIKRYDREHVQEISLALEELHLLSWTFRKLDNQIRAPGCRLGTTFSRDLRLLQLSAAFTLQDVWTILGKIPEVAIDIDYLTAWQNVRLYCRHMGEQNLFTILKTYKHFAYGLRMFLLRHSYSQEHMDSLRHQIYDLQMKQLLNRRPIPPAENFHTLSLVPVQQSVIRPPHQWPISPTLSEYSDEVHWRPAAPSPPALSPTTTFSTTSHASSAESEIGHWGSRIFSDLPATMLDGDPERSRYSDKYLRGSSILPGAEYKKIFQIKFPGNFRIKLYLRSSDYRCEIVCTWPEDRHSDGGHSCMPLDELHIKRAGPLLHLCYPTIESPHICWAMLKFTAYEMLVIFHCTFLSLRSHNRARYASNEFDHEVKGESCEFGGTILDVGYRHALRLWRDEATNVVRLEASVLNGVMKHCPIWTAFITHSITSPTWFHRPRRSATVYLAELQRHVFSSQYSPYTCPSGEHCLEFEDDKDAKDFVKAIERLGEEHGRMASAP
ncbi:hypothetical protein EDD36DRAFT_157139 [Exophiala viscosa]|uniref:Uncharacterized protein n=1 Tax=Exophiala viscosa TaxID=2486360 RepID=A0AAN6E4W1_9EURO|nr:hypothetical protein EDD36DRAFT_157139 [Exophiala viscosa]